MNELLKKWLEDDILLHHAGMPVGSIKINATYNDDVAGNINISLQTL